MSSSSLLPGGNGSSGGISDVVSQDDLTRFAQIAGVLRYLTAPLDPPPPASSPSSIAPGVIQNVFRNTAAAAVEAGIDNAITHKMAAGQAIAAGEVGTWTAMFVQFVFLALGPILDVILGVLDGIRKGADPQVGQIAVTVMNEFLGTDFTNAHLPLGISTADHVTRGRAIGALLYTQLEAEFVPAGGQVVPTVAPAQTFSGIAMNFGLASGIMGLLGGLVPGGFHVDELRELGEEVARNIGLGRLVRRALTPLIDTLVSKPAQWAINAKYTPAQFSEPMLVNPYLANTLDHATLYNAMHLLGYSDDKIQAFIRMHQKKLSPSEVKLLLDHGDWTEQQAEDYMGTLGWPAEMKLTPLLLEERREERTWIARLVDEIEAEVKAGRVTIEEFTNVLQGLPYSQATKDIIAATVAYKAKAAHAGRPAKLSGGELFYAFAAGLVTDSEVRDRWTAQGLPAEDQDLRMQLWLLHLNRLHELEAEKQQAYQAKQTAFLEKQAGQKKVQTPPIPPIPPFPLG